jgi:hypothetical protein
MYQAEILQNCTFLVTYSLLAQFCDEHLLVMDDKQECQGKLY